MPQPEKPTAAAATTSGDLDARYGRTRSSRRRTTVVVAASALAFAVVFVAWLVWGGLLGTSAELKADDRAHEVLSDSEVSVSWALTAPTGADTRCAVQALNSTFAIVGWKVIDIPPSSDSTRSLTDTVVTSERAVTGLIYRCWLT